MIGLGIGTKYYPAILAVFFCLWVLKSYTGNAKSRLLKLLKYTAYAIFVFLITNPHVVLNFSEFALDKWLNVKNGEENNCFPCLPLKRH
jgi:uncharacterized membrane protein